MSAPFPSSYSSTGLCKLRLLIMSVPCIFLRRSKYSFCVQLGRVGESGWCDGGRRRRNAIASKTRKLINRVDNGSAAAAVARWMDGWVVRYGPLAGLCGLASSCFAAALFAKKRQRHLRALVIHLNVYNAVEHIF